MSTVPTQSHLREASVPGWDPWRTGIFVFVLTFILSAVVVIGILAALDPYDTGRFALAPLWRGHVDPDKVSRGRDPQFDSAIIGNSRIEMVRPAQLDETTGLRFVSLYIHGAHPIEQFPVLRYFLRYHPAPRAIVIGLDETWCFNPLRSEIASEFPAWLYEDSTAGYLAHLYSFRVLKRAWDIRRPPDNNRADGFEDYEPAFHALGADAMEVVRKKFSPVRPVAPYISEDSYPAVPELDRVLRDVPASTVVVLAWVPFHISIVPLPNTAAERAAEKCKAAFAALASARPRTEIVDWYVDRPESRMDEAFLDRVHYRTPIATAFGGDIVASLKVALSE